MPASDDVTDSTVGSPVAASRRAGDGPVAGDVIGRYRLDRLLGEGGMGVVWAAHDPDLERHVAVKLLRGARAGDDQAQARARLLREARAMAKLSHPNVITVHEVGTAGDRDFVAMELIDGQSAAEWLAAGRRPIDEVLRVFTAAGRGLAAAHAAGLVHRDFKPHNVLIGRDGKVVVTDFGLARAVEPGGEATAPVAEPRPAVPAGALDETMPAQRGFAARSESEGDPAVGLPTGGPIRATPARSEAGSLSSTLTRTGAMLGTPAYMAPEQFAGAATGPRTDQFAFCVAVWEGLAGARPFRGGSIDELRRAVEAGRAGGGDPLPARLRAVLLRGLSRDPGARWPDMDALLAALERARRGPWRLIGAIAAAAVVVAVVLTIVVLAGRGQRGSAPAPVATVAGCGPGDDGLAPVWSAGAVARLGDRFGGDPEPWARVRGAMDDVAARWRAARDAACAAPDAPSFHGAIACLDGVVDELAAIVEMLGDAPPEMLRAGDLREILPAPETCGETLHRKVPRPPEDAAVRDEVGAIRRELAAARVTARALRGEEAVARGGAALDRARALKKTYAPILAEALHAQAVVLQMSGQRAEAEAMFDEAATVAEATGYDFVRAWSLMGQLELLVERSSDAQEIHKLEKRVTAAIAGMGGDPALQASVDMTMANVAVAEGRLDEAIAHFAAARAVFVERGDLRRSGVAAEREASIRMLRNQAGDAEAAEALLRKALDAAEQVHGAEHALTIDLVEQLGWQLLVTGRRDDAHAKFARAAAYWRSPAGMELRRRRAGKTQILHGRVVDPAGAPVAGARVWAGQALIGDAVVPAFEVMNTFPVAGTAETDATGAFAIEVPVPDPGADPIAVLAADATRRSRPHVLADGVVVTIGPTGSIEGTVTIKGDPAGMPPQTHLVWVPRLQGPSYSMLLEQQPTTFRSDQVPTGPCHVGLAMMTPLGDAVERVVAVNVKAGATTRAEISLDLTGVVLDAIVRTEHAGVLPSAQLFTFDRPMPRKVSLADLIDAVIDGAQTTIGIARPVDARTRTEAGAALYQPGDLHARLSAIPRGAVSVCVVPFAGDASDATFFASLRPHMAELEATCHRVEIAATPDTQARVLTTPPMKRLP